jgi:flagellar basal-body rod protein FlgB
MMKTWGKSMLTDVLFNKTNLPVINRTMDAAMLRAKAISNNIANVNTPGYRRVEIKFEEQLREALDKSRLQGIITNNKHMDIGRKDLNEVHATAYHPYDPTLPSGVNNVDIDMEMAKLAETQLIYNYGVRFGQGIFKKLNAAIQGKSIQS